MEFSIIIPTYMEEAYIVPCLRSIAGQRYPSSEFEIIVSDAESTDRTVHSAREFTGNILIDRRRGIAYGRNAGGKKAKGNILVFVDADTILHQDFLSECHRTFQNPSVVCMTGIASPGEGTMLQRFVYYGTYRLVCFFQLFGLSLYPGICVAFRRSAFLSLGGFREDFGIVEDLDLSRRMARLGACRVNTKAQASVSTRRLKKNLFSTVLFHVVCDIRYLFTGNAPSVYPKTEEISTWRDLWKLISHTHT